MEKDVLQILTEDHAILGWFAQRLAASKAGRSRSVLFNEFARSLGAHQTVVDQTIVPALKRCGWRGLSSDVLTGHLALKRQLAETLTLRTSTAFDEAIPRLIARSVQQCVLEQDKLMPLLHQYLDDDQREALAAEAEQHLTRLLGEGRHLPEDSGLTPQANDLVEEAYVVLSSLPADDELTRMPH